MAWLLTTTHSVRAKTPQPDVGREAVDEGVPEASARRHGRRHAPRASEPRGLVQMARSVARTHREPIRGRHVDPHDRFPGGIPHGNYSLLSPPHTHTHTNSTSLVLLYCHSLPTPVHLSHWTHPDASSCSTTLGTTVIALLPVHPPPYCSESVLVDLYKHAAVVGGYDVTDAEASQDLLCHPHLPRQCGSIHLPGHPLKPLGMCHTA